MAPNSGPNFLAKLATALPNFDVACAPLMTAFYALIILVVINDAIVIPIEIREYYDEWRKSELNKSLKKSGKITGLALSVIAIATTSGLTLKRKGTDIINGNERL